MGEKMEKIYEELHFLSDRISNQTRTIALSILAIAWLFLVGGADAPVLPLPPERSLLLLAGAGALASLLTDYLQYLFGYFATDQVRRQAEESGREEVVYDYDAWLYRLRTIAFWGKQVCAIAALIVLGVAVVSGLLAN